MSERRWLWIREDVALAIHDEQIAEHGGPPGVRDRALLQSALARPQNFAAYQTGDAAQMAAAYAFGIARNHPFVDGNKRTAFTVAITFLWLNGWEFTATDADAVTAVLALASGDMDEGVFADWLRRNIAIRQ